MTEKLDPQQLKAWRLFLTAHAKLINKIDAQLQAANQIALHWYDVLIELYEAPQHRLRMSELAERVVLSRSGLTRLVDRLEKQGFIERQLDPDDRRSFYAHITEEGIEAVRAAWPVYAQGIQAYFGHYLSKGDSTVFIKVLNNILGAL